MILLSSTSATISPANAVVKIAALELAPRNIRVKAVSPGPIATEIMDKIGLNDQLEHQLIDSIPLSRLGKPDEVADLITFLSGSNSSFITGSNFLVDGGQSV
mgnify:CR=1 FL=1